MEETVSGRKGQERVVGRAREKVRARASTTAEAYLELLSLRGIDYFFANAGTDFVSIVEAFAARMEEGKDRPQPMTVPHEIPLVSMAHGYYLATGRPQMAMVHVGIGSANGLGALMHAHRARVPILLSAGRTPVTEEGDRASRNIFIHWGQESFDQAGIVREYVKWDYELRTPAQLETVLDRAMAMAMTEPRGPIYITLPREVLASPPGEMVFHRSPRYDLPTAYPDPAKINEAAELLCRADFPLIITSAAGRRPDGVRALTALAEDLGIGVISFNPEYMNFPTEHFCHQGFSPDRLLPRADVILVVDCDVPWYPNRVKPRDSAVVIQAGVDPLYSAYPIRGFPSDLTIQGDPAVAMSEMTRAAGLQEHRVEARILSRKEELERMHEGLVRAWEEDGVRNADEAPLDPLWVCRNVQRILTEETVVINERDNGMHPYTGQEPGSYFCTPHAGYLGWGFGAALGFKLARPDRTVLATVGDGCYIFGVPSACHFVSKAYGLPVLVIVFNNQCYEAVKGETRVVYPEGRAAGTNQFPLSELLPTAGYEKICEAFGGYGEKVESPAQLAPALDRALHAVRVEKRQALLNVVCRHP